MMPQQIWTYLLLSQIWLQTDPPVVDKIEQEAPAHFVCNWDEISWSEKKLLCLG